MLDVIERMELLEARINELEKQKAPSWVQRLRSPRPNDDRYQTVIFDGTPEEFEQAVAQA
jgi:hypothetical protein